MQIVPEDMQKHFKRDNRFLLTEPQEWAHVWGLLPKCANGFWSAEFFPQHGANRGICGMNSALRRAELIWATGPLESSPRASAEEKLLTGPFS
jgi:hypothetical protein